MANFQIPNQQQYMPQAQTQDEDLLGGSKLTPVDPLQGQLIQQILSALQEEPPVAPPPTKLSKGQRFLNAFRTDANAQKTYENAQRADPAYQEYARKMQAYKGHQEALQPIASLAGNLERGNQAADRESRLREQFDFRQKMAAQFKPETRQEFDVNTGTNRFHTYYRDPMRNNQVVYDEWSDYAPIHQGQYAGPAGEPIIYPTSPMPTQPIPQIAPPVSGASAGAPGVTAVPRPTEGGTQPQGAAPSNVLQRPGLPGRGKAHAASAGAAEQQSGKSAFASGLSDLIGYQRRAYAAQTGTFGQAGLSPEGIPALIGQAATNIASKNQYTQPLVSGDLQAVKDYNVNMQPALFAYVKQQTGVQFGMKEFAMYGSQFPTSMDDPDTAIEKLGGLVRSVRLGAVSNEQQFHGLVPDKQFHAFEGRTMPRSLLRQLPMEERMRFLVGGGQVIDDATNR